MGIGIGIGLGMDRKHPLFPTPVHGCMNGKISKEGEKNMHGSENTPHYHIVSSRNNERKERKTRTGSVPTRSPIHTFRAHPSFPRPSSLVPHPSSLIDTLATCNSSVRNIGRQVSPLHHLLCPNLFLAIAKGKGLG